MAAGRCTGAISGNSSIGAGKADSFHGGRGQHKADGAVPAYDGTDCKRCDCRNNHALGKEVSELVRDYVLKRNELSDEGTG